MIRRMGRILRRVLFVCLLLAVLWQAGEVLQPKKYAEEDMPSTATFRDFYKVEPGTLDVVFLGSSHGVRSFVPQELYNNYGLTSYNLSSQEQSIAISYYWLEEALRLHKPAVAVLDILTVPKRIANDIATMVAQQGVKAIWNFTDVELDVKHSDTVLVEDIHFSDSLLSLSYYLTEAAESLDPEESSSK